MNAPFHQSEGSKGAAGFVLINALVMVAALASIAAFLLVRAEGARQRQMETQSAAQITLYLDAFEALTQTILAEDEKHGAPDHLAEAWARADYDVALDRGRVSGTISDMQGRFNINWLTSANNPQIWESYYRLLERLALPMQIGDQIAKYLAPDGPPDPTAYARLDPAIAPVGGPVLMLEQLRDIPSLSPRDLDRLLPYLAALPADMPLNVNTAPPEVLQAMIPGIRPAVVDRLMQSRRLSPFVSVEDFVERLAAFGAPGILEEDRLPMFGIGSTWFQAQISASLEGHERHRITLFERQPLPVGVRVAYRLTLAR